MEVHQLRYFCAVAETASFTRAAEREKVAQPSLSQQIMKLEQELGGRLFDRLGRTVRLTSMGQVFLPRARAILSELKTTFLQKSTRYCWTNCVTSLFCSCATITASARPPWKYASVPGFCRALSLKLGSSAAFWAW